MASNLESALTRNGDRIVTDAVAQNHAAYNQRHKHRLEREHFGRVALMKDGEVVGIYNDMSDAYSIGHEKYGLGNFSLKRIGERPAQLGILAFTL